MFKRMSEELSEDELEQKVEKRKLDLKFIAQEIRRLTGFFTVLFFYYYYVEDDGDPYITTCLKVLPILMLVIYIFGSGMKYHARYRYSNNIVAGMAISMIGDVLLNLDFFKTGMGVFAITQIFYITAFDVVPVKYYFLALPMYIAGATMVAMVYMMFPALEWGLLVSLPVYGFLLITMCWRSIVRSIEVRGTLSYVATVGAFIFLASDTLICVDKFISPIRYARIYIMTTYYIAQLLLAISTLSDLLQPRRVRIGIPEVLEDRRERRRERRQQARGGRNEGVAEVHELNAM